MANKVLGGGALDGNLGLNPTFADFDIPLGRVVQSVDENGTVFYWLVENTSKGGWLLANGLHANPTKVVGDSLPIIAGSFVDGFTFTAPNQVGIDSNGDEWKYIGNDSLPVVVAPNTDPSASGDFKKLVKPDSKGPNSVTLSELQQSNSEIGSFYTLKDRFNAPVEISLTANDWEVLGVNIEGYYIKLVSKVAYPEFFGVQYGVNYQDDKAKQMLKYADQQKVNCYVGGSIHLNTQIDLLNYPNIQLYGVGSDTEFYWPDKDSGFGLTTGGIQHTGLTISKLRFRAPQNSGIQLVKFSELYQMCSVKDVWIQGGNIGCEISDSWVSCFNNIYIRDGGQYGLILRSPDSLTQVNALTVDGIYVQGYETNWYFDGVLGGGRAIYIPHGASENSRKTSMIIDGFGSVNLGAGGYCVANYSSAVGAGGETLDKTKPVDVLITRTGGVFDGTVSFDKTHFARRDDFNSPLEIVGVYVDPSVSSYIIEDKLTTHVCNTTSYVDYNIYNDSVEALVSQVVGKSNSASTYKGLLNESSLLAYDNNVQTGFTSTWESIAGLLLPSSNVYYLTMVCTSPGVTSSNLPIVIKDVKDNSTLATLTLTAGSYEADDLIRFRIVGPSSATQIKIEVNNPASGGNVAFQAKVSTYSIGEVGSQFIYNATEILNGF